MILGYADKGRFNFSNIPPQLKEIINNPVIYKSKKVTSTRSEQLYETAEWGQFAPFNNLCPEVNGVKSPAGCVATALAIVMKYHNWPDYTRGGSQKNFGNNIELDL